MAPSRVNGFCVVVALVAFSGGGALAGEKGGEKAPEDDGNASNASTSVLGLGSYWRQHLTAMHPLLSESAAKEAGRPADSKSLVLTNRGKLSWNFRKKTFGFVSSPPPVDWAQPDFKDGDWPVVRGSFGTGAQEVGLVCRRGRFVVNDPAGVKKLTMDLSFKGGVVAYLNGHEFARAHLPKGDLSPDTRAGPYPLDAYFVKDGKDKGKHLHWYKHRAASYKPQWALRTRKLRSVPLPVDKLRKGVNVLAMASYASSFPAACVKKGMGDWAPLGFGRALLRAEAAKGAIVPAIGPAKGFSLWNAEVVRRVHDQDFGTPGVPLQPIRIVGARNGRFSGYVVASSDTAIEGLTAKLEKPLASKDGGTIAAEGVEIRFGLLGSKMRRRYGQKEFGGEVLRFNGLLAGAPAKVAVRTLVYGRGSKPDEIGLPSKPRPRANQPIWVAVNVPKDAKAGTYGGNLVVSAKGVEPAKVPIELEIADYAVPDLKDRLSEISIYHSADTLAAKYKKPLWSEEHWKLIEETLTWIGGIGNHTLILNLMSKEQTGNEESCVYWIKKEDGSYGYDFKQMDRYLDLFLKTHDVKQVDAVCLMLYGKAALANAKWGQAKYDENGFSKTGQKGKMTVTLLDPKTGAKSDLQLPNYGTPEAKTTLAPFLKAVREKLEKRGLWKQALIGMPADMAPTPAGARMLHELLPGMTWFTGCHQNQRGYKFKTKEGPKFVPITHLERVYQGYIPDPAKTRKFGWQLGRIELAFNRSGFSPLNFYPASFPLPWKFRIVMEVNLASGLRGAGRLGADYWGMGLKSYGGGTFYSRYPQSSLGQTSLTANCADLLVPGPKGPIPSVRFENLREGIQSAEAVISIQKALLAKKVPEDLAKECWKLLDERVNYCRMLHIGMEHQGWVDRNRKLYRMAAKVSKLAADAGK